MWNQACSQSPVGVTSHKAVISKRAALHILPCTVSQLLSASQVSNDTFAVCNWELNQDCALTFASPGVYVKVTGTLRSFNGQRSLMAMNIYCLKDPNEITSHMLEVVQAHMQIFRKAFDVNMNTTASSLSGGLLGHSGGGHPVGILPNGLSTIQEQVLHVIKRFSVRDDGISFQDLKTQLDYLSTRDLRTSLAFLINEGHVFSTIDEHHFKSSEP
ncbi:replication protein A 32 kDa subunit-like isoform X4 [Micropterus dolomieu]|uniref:replication protein A 32 kDa subunit-like isoform X4 n=1 Tax=Micropterus dolomieu TaxID=147949 RepID=UPI001E8CE637|nr:replication protein A 32 kDa subunit-like isoform X4 [Micropterus dolomieu]